ncbi:MAG TPA: hypothetical protein H9754_00235 [Candidatus Anaerostipes avistercoris]|uniref:Uncharacterized protein n=1 Tax=Candidatus Anaerostipes avistercoris TaxID=2838462 RepID=A0A9D2PGF7_9FIRM|nr:hypothetical protein [Candidatus Anaerostipes avistercoris]
MKKFRKILTLCTLCSICLLSSTIPVSAADDWAGFEDVTIGLSFGTLGKATFYTSVIPSVGSYYSTITMKLQRYSGGSWHTLTSGTNGDTGTNAYSRYYYVTKGYTYRVHSKVTIYKSKGGAKVNSDTFTYKRSY